MSEGKNTNKQIPAVNGWFTMPPEEFHIIANKCTGCGDMSFPPDGTCRNPACSKEAKIKKEPLKGRGKLATYTINHYAPPPPYHKAKDFAPFGVCFVDMEEGLPIKGMVAKGFENGLKVGMDMEAVIETLYIDDDGNEVMIYKFKPVKI